MKVEFFYSPGCKECEAAQANLRGLAQKAVAGLERRELNVLDELEYAVDLGVLTLPAIAVDGELVFSFLPTLQQLLATLTRRATGEI